MAYASARSRSYNSLNVVSTSSGAHGGTLAIDSGLAAAQHVLHSSSPLGSGPFPFAAGSGSGGNSGAGGSLAHIPWLAPPGPPHQPLQQQHHSTSIAHLQQHAQTPYSRTGYLSTDSLATFGLSAAAAVPPPAPAPPLSGSLLSADPPAGFHHHHHQQQHQQQQQHHQHHHSRHAHAGGLQSHRPLGSQSYSSSSDDMSSFGSLSATTSWVAGAYRLATGVPHGNGVNVNVSSGNAAAIGRYTDDTFGIAINTSSGSSGSLGSIYGLGVHGGQSSGRSSPVHHRSSPLLDGHADASNSLPSMFNLSVGSRPRALSAPIEPENLTDGVDLDVECLPTNDSMEKPMLAHDVAAALKSEKYRYLASPNGSASALVTRILEALNIEILLAHGSTARFQDIPVKTKSGKVKKRKCQKLVSARRIRAHIETTRPDNGITDSPILGAAATPTSNGDDSSHGVAELLSSLAHGRLAANADQALQRSPMII